MRLLVCGDRNWRDRQMVYDEISALDNIECVIEGEAKGADTFARYTAEYLGIPVLKFPAQWEKYGRQAGPLRNREMLLHGMPTHVLAFHDNISISRGTKDMVNRALKVKLPVKIVGHNGPQLIFEGKDEESNGVGFPLIGLAFAR